MELDDARTLALTLIAEHNLDQSGWSFEFDRAQQRLGLCNYTAKLISMGAKYVLAADADHVRQTLLHEVAHALVGKRHGHGYVWASKARSIGYTGERTADNPHHEQVRAAAHESAKTVEAAAANVRTGVLVVGEQVVSSDGKYRGLVVSVARTRCAVMLTSTATEVTIPISYLRRANGGDRPTAPTAAVTSKTARKPVTRGSVAVVTWLLPDQRVSINLPGRAEHGALGTIRSVGPKNVVVELDGGRLVRVAKSLLRTA